MKFHGRSPSDSGGYPAPCCAGINIATQNAIFLWHAGYYNYPMRGIMHLSYPRPNLGQHSHSDGEKTREAQRSMRQTSVLAFSFFAVRDVRRRPGIARADHSNLVYRARRGIDERLGLQHRGDSLDHAVEHGRFRQ